MTMRLTGTCVLVLSVLAFAGSAYAGNGNGNGNGNEGGAPGNSAAAPGQVKKDAPAAAAPTTTVVTTGVATPTTTTVAAAPAAANETGVKPSNETAHDTHAEARSDKTKQYGNGQTAGQIAEKNGAAGNTVLHGPGNSQPHKAALCAGGHEVDVHALKSHRSRGCGDPAPTPHPQPAPSPDPGPVGPPAVTTVTTAGTSTTTIQEPSPSEPGSKPAHGESNGEVASSSSGPGNTQGVLSATQRIGRAATLPFTGARLWLAALLGVILIVTGLALRAIRTADARVQSRHDHSDRSRRAARSARASIGGRPGR
jgi:hypothetical protein